MAGSSDEVSGEREHVTGYVSDPGPNLIFWREGRVHIWKHIDAPVGWAGPHGFRSTFVIGFRLRIVLY